MTAHKHNFYLSTSRICRAYLSVYLNSFASVSSYYFIPKNDSCESSLIVRSAGDLRAVRNYANASAARDECCRGEHPRDRQGWDFAAELIPDSRYDRGSDRMGYAIRRRSRYATAETRFQLIITAVRRPSSATWIISTALYLFYFCRAP